MNIHLARGNKPPKAVIAKIKTAPLVWVKGEGLAPFTTYKVTIDCCKQDGERMEQFIFVFTSRKHWVDFCVWLDTLRPDIQHI